MLGQVSVAAATAIIGFDLCRDTFWQQSNRNRRIVALGLCGSAAALDTKCRLQVGEVQAGDIYNAATGPPTRDHMFRIGTLVPAGQEVHLFVEDAPATNPINAAIDFEEL